MYTRARILWSLEKYEPSISEWDQILAMKELDVANKGYGIGWAKSVMNDARFYKTDCLFHLYRDRRGLANNDRASTVQRKRYREWLFEKEAIQFYKVLKYSPHKRTMIYLKSALTTEAQKTRIVKRMDILGKSKDWNKMVRYLQLFANIIPKSTISRPFFLNIVKFLATRKDV